VDFPPANNTFVRESLSCVSICVCECGDVCVGWRVINCQYIAVISVPEIAVSQPTDSGLDGAKGELVTQLPADEWPETWRA